MAAAPWKKGTFAPLIKAQNIIQIQSNKKKQIETFKTLSRNHRQLAIDMEIVKQKMREINGSISDFSVYTNTGPATIMDNTSPMALEDMMKAHIEACLEETLEDQ